MDQEERNKRKQRWMAHGYGIGKRFRESGETIYDIMNDISNGGANEFDAYTKVLEEIETTLHECGIAQFTEKYMIFQLADAELNK